MRQAQGCRQRRAAFTLVELLVVILIIAIMFALAAGAVVKALGKADEVRARNDITQLANGIAAFKTQFQVSYVPDMIVLPPGYDQSGASTSYLTSIWPRLDPATLGTTGTSAITLKNGKQYTSVYAYWGVTNTPA